MVPFSIILKKGLQALLVLVGSGLALSHLSCRAESTPRGPEGGCWVTRLCHLTPNTAQSQAPGCKPRIFQFGAFLGQPEWVSRPPRLADRQSQESCLVGGVSDSLEVPGASVFPLELQRVCGPLRDPRPRERSSCSQTSVFMVGYSCWGSSDRTKKTHLSPFSGISGPTTPLLSRAQKLLL